MADKKKKGPKYSKAKAKTRRDERKEELQSILNSKQITFCRNYILDSSTAVEAYQTAYPTSSYDSARVNASRLLKKPEVIEYVNILLDEQQELIEITDKEIYRELKRIALTSPNENTRLKAIDQLVKLKGMIQVGDTTNNNTLIQIGIVDDSGTSNDINSLINSDTTQDNALNAPQVVINTNIIGEPQEDPAMLINDDTDDTDNL